MEVKSHVVSYSLHTVDVQRCVCRPRYYAWSRKKQQKNSLFICGLTEPKHRYILYVLLFERHSKLGQAYKQYSVK